jgi:hypothetical protein
MTTDPHAEHVAALAEDVWNDFEGSPLITITHRDAESIARSVIASPAMRDLLADERARALREAATEARVRGDIGRDGQIEVWDWLNIRADRETP